MARVVASLPLLNNADMPETLPSSMGRRRMRRSTAHHGRDARDANAMLKSANGMLSIPEITEDEEQPYSWPHTSAAGWACDRCTFLNKGENYSSCEMCQTPKQFCNAWTDAELAELVELAELAEAGNCPTDEMRQGDWPSLNEASEDKTWDVCEVSSVGSSWLDIADVQDFEAMGEDDSDSFAIVGSTAKIGSRANEASRSWASAAAVACPVLSRPVVKKVPRKLYRVGPLYRKSLQAEPIATEVGDDDDADDVLEQLYERRLYPTTQLGKSQRLRCSKGRGRHGF